MVCVLLKTFIKMIDENKQNFFLNSRQAGISIIPNSSLCCLSKRTVSPALVANQSKTVLPQINQCQVAKFCVKTIMYRQEAHEVNQLNYFFSVFQIEKPFLTNRIL